MTYGDFKDLARGTASEIWIDIKQVWPLRFQLFLIISLKVVSYISYIKNEIKQNEQSAEELHKLIIRKIEKRRVYSLFKDDIWGADLADM